MNATYAKTMSHTPIDRVFVVAESLRRRRGVMRATLTPTPPAVQAADRDRDSPTVPVCLPGVAAPICEY